MNQRLAWLSRTVEEPLEPDIPICDPHHHLWEFPESRYQIDEFLADIRGHRIEQTVYVECQQNYRKHGSAALAPVGETEFVHERTKTLQKTDTTRVAAGIVGFADLTLGSAVEEVLESHLSVSPRFRGIRYASAWDASEKIRPSHTNPPSGLLGQRIFRDGFERLCALGLSFDAWVYHPQIPELTELARSFPQAVIVLDHVGGPLGVGPYAERRSEILSTWRRDMAELATCENVFVKIGGLCMTMCGFGWHKYPKPPGSIELAQAMLPYYETCVELFGPKRCMFESNFPMDQASCSYGVLWNAFKRLSQNCSHAERAALFHDTAARVYRLKP